MASDMCPNFGMGQILTTTDAPLLPLSLDFKKKKVERNKYVLAREVKTSLAI